MDRAPLYEGKINSNLSLQIDTMQSLKKLRGATLSFKNYPYLTTDDRKMKNAEAKHLSNDSNSIPKEIHVDCTYGLFA